MDTVAGRLRLAADKLSRLGAMLAQWSACRSCQHRHLATCLQGCQTWESIPPENDRLAPYPSATKGHHHIRLNREFGADLQWWITFAEHCNRVAMFPCPRDPAASATCDASGTWGCGAWSGSSWFQLEWSKTARAHHISFKELFAGLVSCAVWGKSWRGSRV